MTRSDVKALFPDATDEQITNLLNQTGKELEAEKEKTKQFKADASKIAELQKQLESAKENENRVSELQKQLDELQNKDLSEAEKIQKELDRIKAESEKQLEAEKARNAELEKEMKKSETLKQLAEHGITGEDATNFFNEDGSMNFEILGKVLTERETAARNDEIQKIAKNSTNPGGGNAGEKPGDDDGEKPTDVKNAESLNFGGLGDDAQKARDYYKSR